MAERIRLIITGYNLQEKGNPQGEAGSGELTNYPVIPPEAPHGAYRATLILFLDAFVKARDLGWVLSEGTAFDLEAAGDEVKAPVSPEIALVSFERLPADAYLDTILRISPELAVEAVWPSDSAEVMHARVMLYLDHGVSQVWLLAPHLREILVFTPEDRDGLRLTLEDDLHGEGLLAGLSIPLRAIFEEDNALQVEVLRKLIGS